VLIIGSNTAESHPVLATRVKRAHKMHGQKLIVSDLREHEMARAPMCSCTRGPAPTLSGSPR
jgi:predicted molibdopterin-dependent oxidoreductase YjgC